MSKQRDQYLLQWQNHQVLYMGIKTTGSRIIKLSKTQHQNLYTV